MLAEVIHGDCLEVLKTFDSETIDLIYADPPFASGNEVRSGSKVDRGYFFTDYRGLSDLQDNLHPILEECHRVLRSHGSIYIHSDPSFDHVAREMLDDIFGVKGFRNQIIWTYDPFRAVNKYNFPTKHDVILLYAKSSKNKFNPQYRPADAYLLERFNKVDEDGRRYRTYSYRGDRRYYLDEYKGVIVPDWWSDIKALGTSSSKEKVGYPTQKPVALMERIVSASSDEGDVVLDPFCGSGTTLVAAKNLNRHCIGIDKSEGAVIISRERLGC